MSNPTQSAVISIVNQVSGNIPGGFSNNAINLVSDLNNPYYEPNPNPLSYIYKTYTSYDVCKLLPTGVLNTFMYIPGFNDIIVPNLDTNPKTSAIIAQITNFLVRCSGAQIITGTQLNNYSGYIGNLIPDPTYISGISWAQANIGRSIDIDDINAASGYYINLLISSTGIQI